MVPLTLTTARRSSGLRDVSQATAFLRPPGYQRPDPTGRSYKRVTKSPPSYPTLKTRDSACLQSRLALGGSDSTTLRRAQMVCSGDVNGVDDFASMLARNFRRIFPT